MVTVHALPMFHTECVNEQNPLCTTLHEHKSYISNSYIPPWGVVVLHIGIYNCYLGNTTLEGREEQLASNPDSFPVFSTRKSLGTRVRNNSLMCCLGFGLMG